MYWVEQSHLSNPVTYIQYHYNIPTRKRKGIEINSLTSLILMLKEIF